MLKDESIGGIDGGGGKNWAPICDTCRSAPGTVYCQADSAFLCTGCDANRVVSSHERVLVCEACERAPAAFICKADSAALCTKCDSNIHSANPLARRHQRVPILPIPGTLYRPPAIGHDGDAENEFLTQDVHETIYGDDADEAASLMLFNPVKNSNQGNNNGVLLGGEVVNEYLDLDVYNSDQQNRFGDQKNGGNSVVPVQSGDSKNQLQQHQYQSFQMGMDYEPSNTGYGYPASISHSSDQVPVSSLDVNVVPDSSITGASIFHPRPPKGTINLLFSPRIQLPSQLTPMDREARVLRYKEKKKMRKFEKTIRYTSRKAYAETRPRIKGRFAKS